VQPGLRLRGVPVGRGEVLALLGPAGAGKTSLLLALAGFAPLAPGEALLDGRDIAALPARRRDIGLVFDRSTLFPRLSVADNVGFPLRQRRMRRVESVQRVRSALDMLGLGPVADMRPAALDPAGRHRAELARALAFGPAALLLDEPAERQARAELPGELRRLRHRVGFPVVVATRDAALAMEAADRIALLAAGGFVEAGTPAELYAAPRSIRAARALGPVNLLAATVREVRAGMFVAVCNGVRLTQAAAPGAARPALGAPVTLALRPERIGLLPEGEAADNQLTATLRGIACEPGGFLLSVASPLGELSLRLPFWRAPFAPEPGMELRLGWAADASCVLLAE
jgi:putative spermidine/putrescine transport system ATP-binding protein